MTASIEKVTSMAPLSTKARWAAAGAVAGVLIGGAAIAAATTSTSSGPI